MMDTGNDHIARRVEVSGVVQGVGFRPFIFWMAERYQLKGEVANTSSGVIIHIEGSREKFSHFLKAISSGHPPLAHITDICVHDEKPKGFKSFSIIQSISSEKNSTLISPDMAVCDDCLQELFDPDNRRFEYPFINCTNCGPRYTIIEDIPYDRPKTSMKHFKMCDQCRAEYENPRDRRFHAQPNACFECGPRIFLCDNSGNVIDTPHIVKKLLN